MKKIFISLFILLSLFTIPVNAEYNQELNSDPVFMEDVYNFINTSDTTDWVALSYCEQVYLEATRRRDYTDNEIILCWNYFTKKNNEEKAYMQYMFNNREFFY